MPLSFSRLRRRLAALLRSARHDREMDDEMRFHLEMEARDLRDAGLPDHEAMRQAGIAFGGVERHKESGRDARGVRLVQDLGQDLRYAVRQLVANPAFTLATLLTLSLGIGATTIMYSMMRGVVMDPLPFANGERLVDVHRYSPLRCRSCGNIASGNFIAFRAATRTMASLSLIADLSPTFRGVERSEVIRASSVTTDYFSTVQVSPLIGRVFLPDDSLPDAVPVAILSETMWRTRFGADPSIVGRTITLDGASHVVRGVISKALTYPERTDVWTVLKLDARAAIQHNSNNYRAVGRLRDGATLAQADAEAATVGERLAREHADVFKDWTLGVMPLHRYGNAGLDDKVPIFMTAVVFVFVIACINLGGLLVARLTRRRRELAVRAAMGAGAARLTRQLLTETLLLATAGGVLGVAFAWWGVRATLRAVPETAAPPGWDKVHVDWHAFVAALALASMAGLIIGLWPSLRFARPSLDAELRDGVRRAERGGRSGGERLRRALVSAELALSLVLLAGAGLLVRSVSKLAEAPVGFASDHLLTMRLQLPPEVDGRRVEAKGYFDRLAADVARLPGVASVGAVAFLPLAGGYGAGMFQIAGRPELKQTGGTRMQVATPDYLTALRIPLLRGRAFTAADIDSTNRVALINQLIASKFFADEDPIGRVLITREGERLTIVGVVGDVRQSGARNPLGYEIVRPAAIVSRRSMTLLVRTTADPTAGAADIVRAVERFDPNLAINRVRTMDAVLEEYLAPYRVERMLMAGFAAVALFIAIMGLYAIISYGVSTRAREFGVRLALGAKSTSLLALVIGEGLKLTAVGVVFGTAGALGVTRLMRSQLYDTTPTDPLTFGVVAIGMCFVAAAAALVPATRAMRVDPVRSLRAD